VRLRGVLVESQSRLRIVKDAALSGVYCLIQVIGVNDSTVIESIYPLLNFQCALWALTSTALSFTGNSTGSCPVGLNNSYFLSPLPSTSCGPFPFASSSA
jgi:hypothetical protein